MKGSANSSRKVVVKVQLLTNENIDIKGLVQPKMSKIVFNAPSKLTLWKRLVNYTTRYQNLAKVIIVETTPDTISQISTLTTVDIDGGNSHIVVWKYNHDSYFWQPDIIEFHNWKGIIGLIIKLDELGFTQLKNEN